GVHLAWVTADEWYGQKPDFVHGLEGLGLRFVLEIPKNLMGWLREPKDLDTPRGEVQDLARWSTPRLRQECVDFHIKHTQARQTQRVAGKKSGGDDLPGAQGGQHAAGCVGPESGGSRTAAGEGRPRHQGRSEAERRGACLACQGAFEDITGQRDRPRQDPLL